MRGATALVVKELRQHGTALVGLSTLLGLAFLLQWAQLASAPRVLSYVELTSSFLLMPLVIAALILGHRLVVMEYYGHTQRFIEALPARRGLMELVKFSLGFLFLAATAGLVLVASLALAAASEPVDLKWVLILVTRLISFVFCVWSFAFTMGFLGRLRVPLYGVFAAAALFVEAFTSLELSHFGPLAVINAETFAFERDVFPWLAIAQTVGLGAVFSAAGLGLARIREGSLVELLAQPMSQREKSFLFVLFMGVLMAVVVLDDKRVADAYRFTQPEVLRSSDGAVEVMYLEEPYKNDATLLVTQLEQNLAAMREALGLSVAPEMVVRVALSPSLAPDRFRTVRIGPKDGIVVGANFEVVQGWDALDFVTFVLHQVFTGKTHGRATYEPKHWFLDGFSRYWAERAFRPPAALGSLSARVPSPGMLRAIVAARSVELNVGTLERWDQTSEILGDPMATALAYSVLRVLEDRHGRDAVLRLAKAALARSAHADIREWWYERNNPMASLFEDAAGADWSEFLIEWRNALDGLAKGSYAAALESVPSFGASIDAIASADGERSLSFTVALDAPPPTGSTCTFLHAGLPPFDGPVGREGLDELQKLWPSDASVLTARIAGVYGEGERAYAAIECELGSEDVLNVAGGPTVGVPMRVDVTRTTMP